MKIRIHRGGLAESMATIANIEPTAEAIAEYLRSHWGGLGYGVFSNDITVEPYCRDDRIGWDTYIVLMKDCAVAFTDGPLHIE
jgi:hypothetical protein